MLVNQFPKCAAANDSNIPVPKRINTGIKKSQRCSQLPELQKYIETIIKASNDCDSEDTSMSDKERFPKDRKFARYSVFKGAGNKVKAEKFKNQLCLSRSKSNIKAKTPISEAVSRGIRVCSTFVPEFEDPRNWKPGKTKNSSPSPEIEKFLKKFYPNPYHLESVNEFQPTKNDEDEFKDVGTLPDLDISKANIHTEVDIEKRDNDLETADLETCKRENKDTDMVFDTRAENQSTPTFQTKQEDPKSMEVCSVSVPILSKMSSRRTSINSTSNTSSRASSSESISEAHSKCGQITSKKRKTTKSKSRYKPLKNERFSDYDIGKLKLLHLTDSEKSLTRLRVENTMQDEEKDNKLFEDIYKEEDLSDLKEIYDIMHKATESFLYISSKSELYTASLTQSNLFFNELNTNAEVNNAIITTSELHTDKTENESCRSNEQKVDDSDIKVFEKGESRVEKSLIDVLLKEDRFEYRRSPEDRISEQVYEQTESVSNNEEDTSIESLQVDAPQQNQVEKHLTHKNEKNDDVLNFMYGCLKKFNSKEKPPPAEGKEFQNEKPLEKSVSCKRFRKESVTDINYERPTTSGSPKPNDCVGQCENDPAENLLQKTFPDIREIQSKYTAALGEINRKTNKGKSKKRLQQIFPGFESASHHRFIPVIRTPSFQQTAGQMIENVPTMQTVESQNELGAYLEEPQEVIMPTEEIRTPKQICPLSVKRKNSKTNSGKTLKDVLEAEEKLLTTEHFQTEKEKTNDVQTQQLIACKSVHQVQIKNDSVRLCQSGDFKRSTSNFVICVNSIPRNLRSLTSIRPTFPIPLTMSLSDLKGKKLKQLKFCQKLPLRKVTIAFETGSCAVEYTYNIKKETLLMVNQTVVSYTAISVCLKLVKNLSKQVNDYSLQNSTSLIKISNTPIQKPTVSSDCKDSVQPTSEKNTEDDKPVKALIEAIEETEEKLFLLEHNSAENLCRSASEMCSLSESETLKNDLFEHEVMKVTDRKKVHELLVRTFNLQQKLQRYLQKMSSARPTSVSSPLVPGEGILDFKMEKAGKIGLDIRPKTSLPVVHWHLKPPECDELSKTDESTPNTLMIDHSTSYDPPEIERNYEKTEETNKQSKESDERFEETGNDEDDRSSNYSFKSSNDFSESSDAKKEAKYSGHMTTKKYFEKIFNQIESFRKSFEAEKLEKQQAEPNPVPAEEQVDRRVAEYDPKSPAKVLRTVFTGSKSSTELTIGLKDVPMTKVGNISVEKTKFSPNHTKISVAFTKENQEDQNNKISYYFDHMRPSVSTCVTEFSGMKDDDSKSSKSINGDTEDEEDDYKSVCSKPDDSDTGEEEDEKSEPKDEKKEKPSTPKSYTKHRFDFYQKMETDLNLENTKPKTSQNSICRYKELEPLKQALTDMQIRMRNIRRDATFSSNDYYERALKLANMSAGFCQSCGNRAVIPNDTFGYYRTLLPRRSTHQRRNRHFRPTLTSNSSFYSLRSSQPEVCDRFCDLGINHSSHILNSRLQTNRTIFRSSIHDMPILFERM